MSIYEGDRKFQASQEQMINFFVEYCKKYGISKSGTYNPANPTYYEKTKVQFLTMDGDIDVEIENVTWYIKIEFSENGKLLAKGMWDTDDKLFLNISKNEELFFDLLHIVLFETEHQSDKKR